MDGYDKILDRSKEIDSRGMVLNWTDLDGRILKMVKDLDGGKFFQEWEIQKISVLRFGVVCGSLFQKNISSSILTLYGRLNLGIVDRQFSPRKGFTIQELLDLTLEKNPEFKYYRALVKKYVDDLNKKPNKKSAKYSPEIKDKNVNLASKRILSEWEHQYIQKLILNI